MCGLLTQRQGARGDFGVARYCRHRLKCRRRVGLWGGFHVMGACSGSLGASFVPADWRVGVFELSGLLDIPSDRLSVWTILLYEFMYRRSSYRVYIKISTNL